MNATHQEAFGYAGRSRSGRLHDQDVYAVLLGMAGHDLRQPLQVLQSTHDWLENHFGQDMAQAQFARGQRAIRLIAEQLDRLVSVMRLYEQTSNMEFTEVALGPILSGIAAENRDLALARDVELRVRPTGAVVVSNEVVLEGVVRNLVRNAIKYTPAGHEVLIGCRRSGRNVRIDICDTGIGIAPHQVPRAFEAFKRLDSSTSDGLGLGLYVVRRAVALLGHRIEVRSEVGRGSRFSIVVQRADG
jgi:signal transduction histidine kinase